MINEWKLGLKQKFNIKCGLDFIIFVVFMALFVIYSLETKTNPTLCLTYITIFMIVFLPCHLITKQWIVRSIKKSLRVQSESLSNATDDVLENLGSQKKILDTITANTKNISSLISKLQDLSQDALTVSKNTEKQVGQSITYSEKEHGAIAANAEKMLVLRQKIQMIAELILELSEHTQQIGSTISVVDDIAEQTNMLALNAAVEAARAGEHGKGFAVVAGEIRKLADESKQAITKITSLTSNIQYTTNSTVMATEEGSKEIETVVRDINNVSSNSEVLLNLIKNVLDSLDTINQNTEKQNDILEKLKVVDEEYKNISDEFSEILNTNSDKLIKLRELSNDIKNSAIEG